MATQIDLARGWMLKAESDRLTAEHMVQLQGPYDTACFHAQQGVEKYLKAVIALSGSQIPRTHLLEIIYDQCLAVESALVLDRSELSVLTPYAVELRYDRDFWPDQGEAQRALAMVHRVRASMLAVLPPAAHP